MFGRSPSARITERRLTGDYDEARLWDMANGEVRGAPLVYSQAIKKAHDVQPGRTNGVCGDPPDDELVDEVLFRGRRGTCGPGSRAAGNCGTRRPSTYFVGTPSPDGQTLVTRDGDTARLWDIPAPAGGATPDVAHPWLQLRRSVEVRTGKRFDESRRDARPAHLRGVGRAASGARPAHRRAEVGPVTRPSARGCGCLRTCSRRAGYIHSCVNGRRASR